MPPAEAFTCNKSNHFEKYALLHHIQSKLANHVDQKTLLKNYRQWIHKLVPLKKIAFILFDSQKKKHTIYDFFPEGFRNVLNRQLEEGIIVWAGQQEQLFVSEKNIFLPIHCNSNYIGIIEIIPKNNFETIDQEVKLLLEIIGNLIASYFHKHQLEQENNLNELIHSEEYFDLALQGAMSNGMIHEISNPLTTILGRSGLLLNNQERLKPNLEIVERETARISRTIHEFIAISKKHNKTETKQIMNINEIVKKSKSLLNEYAKLKVTEIKLNFQQDVLKSSIDYFGFLGFLNKIIFFKLSHARESQPIKISSFLQDENICIEIDTKIPGNPLFINYSEYVAMEQNGKILIQLPVDLEVC